MFAMRVAIFISLALQPFAVAPTHLVVDSCAVSDAKLKSQHDTVCASLVPSTSWCAYDNSSSASKDWPNQAVYMHTLLSSLSDASTCLNTTYSRSIIEWLDTVQASKSISGSFMWTYRTFQVQYYDMPRKAGDRIESPDTLGRKCWAFSYLKQFDVSSSLKDRLRTSGMNASNFLKNYAVAKNETMSLCQRVMDNCFLNASYDPNRRGTCPLKILDFHVLGFDRENLKRANVVHYPFK